MASTGYSGTPLVRKLGLKPGFRATVTYPPDHYRQLLAAEPPDMRWLGARARKLDFVHLFVLREKDLARRLPIELGRIVANGMIWVSWPKKASKVATDVTEDTVRKHALPLGLVDIKVCAVDEVWSGLKLVIRVENR